MKQNFGSFSGNATTVPKYIALQISIGLHIRLMTLKYGVNNLMLTSFLYVTNVYGILLAIKCHEYTNTLCRNMSYDIKDKKHDSYNMYVYMYKSVHASKYSSH